MRYFIFVLMLSVAAVPAWAGHGKKHNDDKIVWDNGKHENDKVAIAITIGGNDRNIISNYLRNNYGRNCPPGLAKKNNGCLPPGQAKKYGIGHRLNVGYDRLPRDLSNLLGPAPQGTFYGMVDKDVLLISEAGKKVLDAVTLLSAVK
jgi:hypothetical protein